MTQNFIENSNSLPEKPIQVQIIGTRTLICGVANIVYTFSAMGLFVFFVIITYGIGLIGILCLPIFLLPTILGVFEIIYATKLLANPMKPVLPNKTIAVLEICMILGLQIIGPVVGILSLVSYDDQVVKNYFTQLNAGRTS